MPELSVIVPTYNEQTNVEPMIGVLARALFGVDYEIVFVDDASPDGTAALVRQVAQLNPRVRIVHRIGRRGLSSAVIEGMLTSSAPYTAGTLRWGSRPPARSSPTTRRLRSGQLCASPATALRRSRPPSDSRRPSRSPRGGTLPGRSRRLKLPMVLSRTPVVSPTTTPAD